MLNQSAKISLCITTLNRPQQTKKVFENIIDDDRISEVIIVDDKSTPANKIELAKLCTHPKIYLEFNAQNKGVYINKAYSVELARNTNVIVFDSDNILLKDYIDKIFSLNWESATAFLPSFAKPHFDYRNLIGSYTSENIREVIRQKNGYTLLNTMNFFVNRAAYLKAFMENVEPVTADSIFINYRLLRNGGRLEVVAGLEYEHLIHNGSHYKNFQAKGAKMLKAVEGYLKLMK